MFLHAGNVFGVYTVYIICVFFKARLNVSCDVCVGFLGVPSIICVTVWFIDVHILCSNCWKCNQIA